MATAGRLRLRRRFCSARWHTALTAPSTTRLPSTREATRPRPRRRGREATPCMAVTLWVADPPDVSFLSVVTVKPPHLATRRTANFRGSPHVVGAAGRFVLLRAHFVGGCGDELFMYTAASAAGGNGDGDTTELPASLERIQLPDAAVRRLCEVREYGIVPRGRREYLMAALFSTPSNNYRLYMYSSESKTWSSGTLLNPNTVEAKAISPEKVITLGGEGVLGWVDFSSGLLVCDVLSQEPLSLRFIPLPRMLPSNRQRLRLPGGAPSPSSFRDLICVDGVLKFIEIEHGLKVTERHTDPWDNDVLYDSDLIRFLECENQNGKPKPRDGWRAVTWTRMVSGSNCWTKGCVVDVADILVDESVDLSMISGQSCESDDLTKLAFRDLYCDFPVLSAADNGGTVYLKIKVEPRDRNVWAVAVDLGNKTLKALGGFPFGKYDTPSEEQAFRTSTLSCHLVMTPGIEVSAYQKFIQTTRSANNPDNTSILMDEPSSRMFIPEYLPWESRFKIQRLVDQRMENVKRVQEEKIKRARDESRSSRQNDHAAEACAQNNFLESSWKHQRLCAEKNNLPQNEGQSIAQNGHILQVHPVQNNLSPQQCFNMPGGLSDSGHAPSAPPPVFHGYSNYQPLRHQPPPLNAPLAPPPVFHGYSNYQPLRHQPPPLNAPLAPPVFHGYSNYQPPRHQPPLLNQERPSREFESQEAPQPCFNRRNVASYLGYS